MKFRKLTRRVRQCLRLQNGQANAAQYLTELSQAIRTGSYVPQAVRRVNIPKAGGGQRPLGIPTVKDRVVQAALKSVLEPIFEIANGGMAGGLVAADVNSGAMTLL